MSAEVRRFASLEALSRAACTEVESLLVAAIYERGTASLALSGGSTPKPLYTLLAASKAIGWAQVKIFFGDERSVGPTDEQSNFRMAKETLLDRIPVAHAQRMEGEAVNLDAAALAYETLVMKDVPDHVFDVILLGIGPDGHTASLFPGTRALQETQRLVVENDVPQLKTRRLTFTYPLLNAARNAVFLVAGEDKMEPLEAILAGGSGLPAERVHAKRVLWLVCES